MKTFKIVFLVGCALFTLGCLLFPIEIGGDAKRTLGEEVKTYPVTLKGSATVSTPYDAATCVRQGSANFEAYADETCTLYVSFPMTYTDTSGKCVENGDTQAWLLKGSFVKGYQVCRFTACNDNADYEATEFVRFYPFGTDSTTVSCSLVDKNKRKVTIELPALNP